MGYVCNFHLLNHICVKGTKIYNMGDKQQGSVGMLTNTAQDCIYLFVRYYLLE